MPATATETTADELNERAPVPTTAPLLPLTVALAELLVIVLAERPPQGPMSTRPANWPVAAADETRALPLAVPAGRDSVADTVELVSFGGMTATLIGSVSSR